MGHHRIGIIDIGLSNINSVARALELVGASVEFIDSPARVKTCDKLVFPGVGSYNAASLLLEKEELGLHIVDSVIQRQTPILGICLGMQLLGTNGSENGGGKGLSLIPAEVHLMKVKELGFSLPHIGWNDVTHPRNDMFHHIPQETSFYFVHSYCMPSVIPGCDVAICQHGVPFAAAVQKGWIWGTQFHPEKSQKAGLKLLKNFVEF